MILTDGKYSVRVIHAPMYKSNIMHQVSCILDNVAINARGKKKNSLDPVYYLKG